MKPPNSCLTFTCLRGFFFTLPTSFKTIDLVFVCDVKWHKGFLCKSKPERSSSSVCMALNDFNTISGKTNMLVINVSMGLDMLSLWPERFCPNRITGPISPPPFLLSVKSFKLEVWTALKWVCCMIQDLPDHYQAQNVQQKLRRQLIPSIWNKTISVLCLWR